MNLAVNKKPIVYYFVVEKMPNVYEFDSSIPIDLDVLWTTSGDEQACSSSKYDNFVGFLSFPTHKRIHFHFSLSLIMSQHKRELHAHQHWLDLVNSIFSITVSQFDKKKQCLY